MSLLQRRIDPNARRGVRLLLLAAFGVAAGAGASLSPTGAAATAVNHPDCQIHGVRPYSHRHVGPDGRVVTCDRPVITGRFATAARCVAQAVEGGEAVLGTRSASELPLAPDAPARTRAAALNQACVEAVAGCEAAANGVTFAGACQVVDRHFAR